MHSKSDNIKIMIYDSADEVFASLLNRYKIELETSMRGSETFFDKYNSERINYPSEKSDW